MSRIWQIALRELRAYFFSPIAYIVITSFLVLNGFIFSAILAAYSRPDAPNGSIMQVFLGRSDFLLQLGDAAILDLRGQVQIAGSLRLFLFRFGFFQLLIENADRID